MQFSFPFGLLTATIYRMNRGFSFGLIGRIVTALALVFTLLIVLNELTVTSVVHLTLENTDWRAPLDADALQQKKAAIISGIRRPVAMYTITAAILSLLIASLAIYRIAVKPLRRITKALGELSAGKNNVHVPVVGASEVTLLATNFNKMFETIRAQRTELEQRLEQLEQTTAHLKNAQDDLIRAAQLASVGTLASGVAHEIGNPVTGVLGLLDAIENETNEDAVRTYHTLIKKEVHRIDKTIRDLLSFARPTASTELAHTELQPVLTHVQDLVRVQKAFSRIALEFNVPTNFPALSIGKDDLTAMLVNLCLNAAQAIDGAGYIHIGAEVVPASSSSRDVHPKAVIHIKDDGPGVPADIAGRIFDPFFTKRKTGDGSGLGLAICQNICESNGGAIELFPPNGAGAHFAITLSVAKSESV